MNAWKRSEAAGRTWAVDSAGVATLIDVGLVWRGEVCAQVFEEAAVDLGRGLDAFSRSRAGEHRGRRTGFPTFKRKGRARESFRIRTSWRRGRPSIHVGGSHHRSITLPVIGVVKVVEDTRRLRRFLRPGYDGVPRARIWFATVSRHRARWVIALNVEALDLHPAMRHPQREGDDHGFVGIDRGLSAWLVVGGTDGTELIGASSPAPRPCAAQTASGYSPSGLQAAALNRRKADIRLNRIHGRIADQRRYATHEVTTRLVKTHDRICMEDLAAANLVRNRHLARPIADAAGGAIPPVRLQGHLVRQPAGERSPMVPVVEDLLELRVGPSES